MLDQNRIDKLKKASENKKRYYGPVIMLFDITDQSHRSN